MLIYLQRHLKSFIIIGIRRSLFIFKIISAHKFGFFYVLIRHTDHSFVVFNVHVLILVLLEILNFVLTLMMPTKSWNFHIESVHGSRHAIDELWLAVIDVQVNLAMVIVLDVFTLFHHVRKLSSFKIGLAKFVFGDKSGIGVFFTHVNALSCLETLNIFAILFYHCDMLWMIGQILM